MTAGQPTGAAAPQEPAHEQVRRAVEACVAAFGAHDTPGYFACFDPAATFLFHGTQRLLGSRAEYETEWATWEGEGFHVLGCTSTDQRIDLHGDVAVLTHRVRTEVSFDGRTEVQHERETIVLLRDPGGRWIGVHEHLSVDPTDG